MADQELSIISKRRDYSNIVTLQDPGVLEEFLAEPLTFIAETITGALGVGKFGVMASGGRIVQALMKAQLFEQWAAEFRAFREKGRIPSDFADSKYGFQTWVELMSIIDEESPDVDRLEALKAMFFAVNKVNTTDGERIAAYHLWQIAKTLNSGEIFLLKLAYEARDKFGAPDGYSGWSRFMAQAAGHNISGLIDLHEKKPTELGLFSARQYSDLSGITPVNARLTEFGLLFCQNIETYVLERQEII